jgi:hypothetical protein
MYKSDYKLIDLADLQSLVSNNVRPKYQLLQNTPRIPFYITDTYELQATLLTMEKYRFQQDDYTHAIVVTPSDRVEDAGDDYDNDDTDCQDHHISIKCPIRGCSNDNKDFALWICCGVIACCECIVEQYEFKSLAICPWCGSVASDWESLIEMIVPVEQPWTCLLSTASLIQLKIDKGDSCNAKQLALYIAWKKFCMFKNTLIK